VLTGFGVEADPRVHSEVDHEPPEVVPPRVATEHVIEEEIGLHRVPSRLHSRAHPPCKPLTGVEIVRPRHQITAKVTDLTLAVAGVAGGIRMPKVGPALFADLPVVDEVDGSSDQHDRDSKLEEELPVDR
jgi:hypothetical protein